MEEKAIRMDLGAAVMAATRAVIIKLRLKSMA
jgi:hypothetical protein